MLIKTLNIKVSFEWTFENSQRWAATNRVRQTVPGARCCDGEGAVAHCGTSRRRHDEIGQWRGAQATPWFRTRDRADGILQVARCGPLNALVNQYAQLVLDALRYAQPVEVGKERSDVVTLSLSRWCNHFCKVETRRHQRWSQIGCFYTTILT